MIRREVRFADASPQWLLISQVEHARLSGYLAEKCLARFGEPDVGLDSVRHELLQAITHHDDGWAEWETKPRLDPDGRPLSFMEVALEDALAIWERSIQSAEKFGELAAWVVAGHFSALLATVGNHVRRQAAQNWLREVAARRSEWFGLWHSRKAALHTVELAGEALKWVQLFDILSLWPCSQYPVLGEPNSSRPEPFHTATDWIMVSEIRPGGTPGRIVFDPWPFEQPEIELQVAADLAPVRRYGDSEELLRARVPFVAKWVLCAVLPPGEAVAPRLIETGL